MKKFNKIELIRGGGRMIRTLGGIVWEIMMKGVRPLVRRKIIGDRGNNDDSNDDDNLRNPNSCLYFN